MNKENKIQRAIERLVELRDHATANAKARLAVEGELAKLCGFSGDAPSSYTLKGGSMRVDISRPERMEIDWISWADATDLLQAHGDDCEDVADSDNYANALSITDAIERGMGNIPLSDDGRNAIIEVRRSHPQAWEILSESVVISRGELVVDIIGKAG